MQVIIVKNETYRFELGFIVNCQYDSLLELAKNEYKIKLEEDGDDAEGRYFPKDSLIWIKHFTGTPEDIARLSHECLHAVGYLLRFRGIELSDSTDEAYCYLLQWMVFSFIKQYKHETRRNRGEDGRSTGQVGKKI